MVWAFICFELPDLSTLAPLISKGEESSGSNLSALIPSSDLLLMMPRGVLKNGWDVSRPKFRRSQFPNIAKGVRGRFTELGRTMSDVIHLSGV